METTQVVHEGFVGLLYESGRFVKLLEPGVYDLSKGWFDRTKRVIRFVDVRERSITIKGQEILTADKVAIRVSLLVYIRVTDPEAALHRVASYEDRVYEDVQLAARRFLASRDLDAILSDRNEISDAVRDEVREVANGYGVEVLRADVKDLIFPGNLRDIMNQVLETERRAEARLVEARRDAEAGRIHADAQREEARLALDASNESARARAETQAEVDRLALEADIRSAQALIENPQLLRLRELQALEAMASSGARFSVGLDSGLDRFFDEPTS